MRSTRGYWELVNDYNGECKISGAAGNSCVPPYGTFSMKEGQYKLDQITINYETQGLDSCYTVPPGNPPSRKPCVELPVPAKERVSCFSDWANSCGRCSINYAETDYCMINHNPCDESSSTAAFCMRHIKSLYRWTCADQLDCDFCKECNLGNTCP